MPENRYGLLRHHAQLVPVAGQVVFADVHPVGQHRSPGHVVEPRHQLDQGRLSRAGLADQCHGLAGLDGQADPAHRVPLRPVVPEPDVAQLDPAGQPRHRPRVRGLGRGGRHRQQLPDPAQPDHRLLVAVEYLGQLLHRCEEQVDVEQVGDQRPRRQRAAAHLAGRDHEDEGSGDRGQRLDEREVQRDVALGPQPAHPVGVTARGEPGPVALPPGGRPGSPAARPRSPAGPR